MPLIEIPIQLDVPTFTQRMDLDEVTVIMKFNFNERLDRWVFSLANGDGEPLLEGIPVHVNLPLTDRFINRIAGIPPGQFLALDESGLERNPDRVVNPEDGSVTSNFGTDVRFFYDAVNG